MSLLHDSGDGLFDSVIAELEDLDDREAVIGILEGAGSDSGGGMTLAGIAAVHEFGYDPGNIPERSFLRRAADENQGEIISLLTSGIGKLLEGQLDATAVLTIPALRLQDQAKLIVREPASSKKEALKPETIRAKERAGYPSPATPLVARGDLLHALTMALRRSGGEGQ